MTDDNPTQRPGTSPNRSEDAATILTPAAIEAALLTLIQGAQAFGLVLEPAVASRFLRFALLLDEGNRQLNLTRIRPEDVTSLHFLDSLALAAVHRPASGARLLDVGTGAGFPGVPLALAFPDIHVTLLDSTRKRLAWLDGALADLKLTNAHTLHARAEELARDSKHRERYDVVTARAVAPLSKLADWLLPFVRPGGVAVAYKSQEITAELQEAQPTLQAQGAIVEQVAEISLSGTDIVRKLIMMRKLHSAPLPQTREKTRISRK